jgi:predicted small metal-binding protein
MPNRKYLDCRDMKGSNCSLRISGTEDEVMGAAMAHAKSAHGEMDTPEFRKQLRAGMKNE